MRRLLAALALLAIAGLLVWAFAPRPVEADLAQIAPRTIEVAIEEEGEARIREVFTVSATIGGKLSRTSLHPGDEVLAGETVVARIGPAAPALLDSRARAVAVATVAAAQAAVDLARAQLAQAEATLDFATAEADRSRALFEKATISKRMYDNAVLAQKTAAAAVDSARASLAVRERELESAAAVLSADGSAEAACCVEIVAPVSGRVLRVLTEDEQVVLPGTPLMEIGNPGDLKVVVDLLSRDAVRVREGAEAVVDGWGGAPIPARVERVEPSAVTKVSALGIDEQRVEVVLALAGDPADRQLLGHGFRVIARITIWKGEGVLAIPVGALFRDGADWAAWVLRDGRARLTPITLGERNDDWAMVLTGLAAGDEVVLHPSDQIADGVAITARPAP